MNKYFPQIALGILALTCGAFLYGSFRTPEAMIGATVTDLTRYMTGSTSMAVINTNFDNLNSDISTLDSDKIELTDLTDANIPDNLTITNTPGYITDGNTLWNNTYGYITATTSVLYLPRASWGASSTLLLLKSSYYGTTTLPARLATTTGQNGIDISGGCFAIDGTCVAGGTGTGSGTVNNGTAGQLAYYAANGTEVSGTSSINFEFSDSNIINIGNEDTDHIMLWANSGVQINALFGVSDGESGFYISNGSQGAFFDAGLFSQDQTFTFPDLSGTFAVIDSRGRLTLNNITANLTGTASTSNDLVCTDCINATEIEDIYLLTAGDTMNGKFTFGMATGTALTVTNLYGTLTGTASAVGTDAIGEITDIAAALKDGSGDCGSGLICLGDHTHSSYLTSVGVANLASADFGAFTCNGSTCSLDVSYEAADATLTDIADGTIAENLVNTANPWADNEVADALTVNMADNSTIVNGATPTVNAAGEIAVDTTSDQLKYYGGAERVIPYTKPICYTASTSAALTTGTTTLGVLPFGFTVYRQSGKTLQGTSIKLRLHDGTNWMTQYTATATRAQYTPATNNTWTAGEEILLSWSNVTGAVWGFNYCAYIAPIGD